MKLADGTLCRQLLPWGATGSTADIRKQYRWVTWDTEPITRAQAEIHVGLGGPAACVVVVFRGPKGGWSDARFVRRHDGMPKNQARQVKGAGIVERTYYYGWVQERVAPNYNLPVPLPKDAFGDHYRAHLLVHAGA